MPSRVPPGNTFSIRVLAGSLGSSLSPATTLWDAGGNFLASVGCPGMNLGTACCLTSCPRAVPITSVKAVDHPSAGGFMDTVFPPCPAPSHPQCKSCSLITVLFPSMALLPGQPVSLLAPCTVEAVAFTSTTQTGLISMGVGQPGYRPIRWVFSLPGPGIVGEPVEALYVEARDSWGTHRNTAHVLEADTIPPWYRRKPFPPRPAQRYCNFTGLAAMHRPGCIITRWITRSMPVHGSPYPMTYHPPKPLWYLADSNPGTTRAGVTMPGMQAPTRSPEQ